MKLNFIRRESGLALLALFATVFAGATARADFEATTANEPAMEQSNDSDTVSGDLDTEWTQKEGLADDSGAYETQHDRWHPRPRPYPRPYPRPVPHPRPYPRPAPHPRPYPRPIPRWPVPPYIPPYAPPYLYTCYAENARGETFESRAYNPNVAQDEAVEDCYEWGSESCYAIGCD